MKGKKLEERLEIVQTKSVTYLGYLQESEKYMHLSHAVVIPNHLDSPTAIAFAYFCEKARKRLKSYDIPLTAIEMKLYDTQVETMVAAYLEMSKIANKGALGKYTISRLQKMLKRGLK